MLAACLAALLLQQPAPAAELPAAPAPDAEPSPAAPPGPTAALDRLVEDFLAEHQVPGAAVAVAKDGRLLYARGFGLADPEAGEPVRPESLFRIASISKPLTALTVLRMVEAGELGLDDLLVDRLALAREALDDGADPRLVEVTLRQLLQHTGGWDRGVSFDPMFAWTRIRAATPASTAHPDKHDVARFGLRLELDHDPGAQYAYSNFGYLLLGLVIEERTGKAYDAVVRERLYAPLGIAGAAAPRLGRTALEHRAPGEVRYVSRRGPVRGTAEGLVGAQVPGPYGAWNLEWMDAHGGWIASAVDLVRVADAVQGGAFLEPASAAAMVAPPTSADAAKADADEDGAAAAPSPGVHYGLGWSVRTLRGDRGRNLWHTGSLDGTSTLLVLRHDGYSWAVLFNARSAPDGRTLSGLIDGPMHRAVDAVESWPDARPFAAPEEE